MADYILSIVVRVKDRDAILKVRQAVTDASVDETDSTVGVQSFAVSEVPGRTRKSECDTCGGPCIGADA